MRVWLSCICIVSGLTGALENRAAPPVFHDAGYVQAGEASLRVASYSVPALADWNADGRPDLLVGETVSGLGKVRLYLNEGTTTAAEFRTFSYLRAGTGDLQFTAVGCLGICPRVTDWNGDGLQDLVVGLADGAVRWLRNAGSASAPALEVAQPIEASSAPGQKSAVNVGGRAMPWIVDWNNDGSRDLLVGGADGRVRLYTNGVSAGLPDLSGPQFLRLAAADLVVPDGRAAIAVADLDGDGRKDLVAGNTSGQVYFYANGGTDAAPALLQGIALEVDGVVLDLPGTPRSRPFAADVNGDGAVDLWVGAQDGYVRVYLGVPPPPVLLSLPSLHEGVFRFQATGGGDRLWSLEACADLCHPVWEPLTPDPGAPASMVWTDTNPHQPSRFYRLISKANRSSNSSSTGSPLSGTVRLGSPSRPATWKN